MSRMRGLRGREDRSGFPAQQHLAGRRRVKRPGTWQEAAGGGPTPTGAHRTCRRATPGWSPMGSRLLKSVSDRATEGAGPRRNFQQVRVGNGARRHTAAQSPTPSPHKAVADPHRLVLPTAVA
jgi:hypothetical protein